jgi:hypothetical protein
VVEEGRGERIKLADAIESYVGEVMTIRGEKAHKRTKRILELLSWFTDVLKNRKATATCDLLFHNGKRNPEGHFLYKLKSVGKRAGIKCKNCVVREVEDDSNCPPAVHLARQSARR